MIPNNAESLHNSDGKPITISRREAARRLGLRAHSLGYAEEKGWLTPIRDARGRVRYDVEELERYAREQRPQPRGRVTRGTIAAAAFVGFARGKTVRELVVELRQPPDVVAELWRAYVEPQDRFVAGELAARLEAILVEHFGAGAWIDARTIDAIANALSYWRASRLETLSARAATNVEADRGSPGRAQREKQESRGRRSRSTLRPRP